MWLRIELSGVPSDHGNKKLGHVLHLCDGYCPQKGRSSMHFIIHMSQLEFYGNDSVSLLHNWCHYSVCTLPDTDQEFHLVLSG